MQSLNVQGETAVELAFMNEVPKRATAFTRMLDSFQLLRDVIATKGLYIPAGFVKDILGVSKQRVHQLINDGRLETVQLNHMHYVTEKSLLEFITAEKKTRGPAIALAQTKREAWNRAMSYGKEFSSTDK